MLTRSHIRWSPTRITRGVCVLLLQGLLVSGLLACRGDVTSLRDPEAALMWVRLNTYAVTLATVAPYNTVRLTATAYRGNGGEIPDAVPRFASDVEGIIVDDTGIVTVLPEVDGGRARIRVSLTYQGVTVTDETIISVINTSSPAPLTTFTLIADSVIGMGESRVMSIRAIDTDGTDRSFTIPIHFESSDSSVVIVNRQGTVTALKEDAQCTLYATSMVYGVAYTDSVRIRTDWPRTAQFDVFMETSPSGEVTARFVPERIMIQSGGLVAFLNGYRGTSNSEVIDIIFETPDLVHAVRADDPLFWFFVFPTDAGNIPSLVYTPGVANSQYQTRWFPVAGTYHFRSERFGAHGTIIVR